MVWISHHFHSADQWVKAFALYGGVLGLYALIVCFWIKRLPYSPQKLFLLIGIFYLASPPVIENDHYLYLWEGKVLASAQNPYSHAPNAQELTSIDFGPKDKIAYPQLTSIYPPLAQLLFLSSAGFSYPGSLFFQQILALLGLLWILPYWFKDSDRSFLLLLPFLTKEFVQAIHIDWLAVTLFTLMLYARGSKAFMWQSLAMLTKVLSLFSVIPLSFRKWQRKQLSWSASLPYLAIVILGSIFLLKAESNSGTKAFVGYWSWNSFPMELMMAIGIDPLLCRKILIGSFGLSYFVLLYRFCRSRQSLSSFNLRIFLCLFGLTPVMNPWYALWTVPFVRMLPSLAFYIFSTFLAYTPYANPDLSFWSSGVQFSLLMNACIQLRRKSQVTRVDALHSCAKTSQSH
jgi:hypothetical protein